jgi:hypothetical protein
MAFWQDSHKPFDGKGLKHVKRKYSDRANWRRVTDKVYQVKQVREPDFEGYVTLYQIRQVRDPLWKVYDGRPYCVADRGYEWMQQFPKGSHAILTTMYNHKGQVVQWYIDICKKQGVTDRGVPWFDDLYLDVVILPSGELYLLDEDELEEALRKGHISREDYELAWREAKRIISLYRAGKLDLLACSSKHRAMF